MEAEHNVVSLPDGLGEKGQLVGNGVRQHEALTLHHQFPTQRIGHGRGGPWVKVQLASQHIGIHEPQAGGLEVRVIERCLASPVRPRQDEDDRALVEPQRHRLADFARAVFTPTAFTLAALNTRFTKRPTVRLPSASMRTSMPGRLGARS